MASKLILMGTMFNHTFTKYKHYTLSWRN